MDGARTDAITAFVASPERLGDVGRDRALQAVVDTVGVLVAGSGTEPGRLVRAYAGPGDLPPRDRALVLGTWAHALDFDDIDSSVPGHSSAVLVPTLLAELGHGSFAGERFVEAFAVGHEVASKLGRVIGQGHYDRGWHSTSTVVVFGAVAALARVRGHDRRTTACALGIAASMAAGLRRNFGTMTKPLHCGWAAHAAHVAADLAGLGFTGAETALDVGIGGFVELYGSGTAERLAPLGAPYTLAAPGITLKRFPCCGGTHRGIDAMLALVERLRPDPEAVRSIDCTVPPSALAPLLTHPPRTGLEGKFSLEYTLAAALLDGRVGLETFTNVAVRRPEVVGLMERVHVEEDARCLAGAELAGRSPHQIGYAEVRVELADGSAAYERVETAAGTVRRPLSWTELRAKFLDCVAVGLPDVPDPDGLFAGLRALSTAPDVDAVTAVVSDLLRDPSPTPMPLNEEREVRNVT
jgi:2-methylcitrate dehydratase PrpD